MLISALLLALGVQDEPGRFHHGVWRGQCYRKAYPGAMDHELCRAGFWRDPSGPGAQLERSADGLSIRAWSGGCDSGIGDIELPAAQLTGRNRAKTVATIIELHIAASVVNCPQIYTALPIREDDIAAFLRASDGLRPESFIPTDPAVRAPAAAKCGAELATSLREGFAAFPEPDDAEIGSMMYTMSRSGPERARARFEARPELMKDIFAFGTGPGGTMIAGRGPAAAWREAGPEWFSTICDIAIEAWSSFVELSVYRPNASEPIFGVRADTGVGQSDGFFITSRPIR